MIAVIADIHGNIWALDAVLADIEKRGISTIVDLGDSLWGSFDPAATVNRLIERGIPSISGNCDRMLVAPSDEEKRAQAYQFTIAQLSDAHLAWLRDLPKTITLDGVLFCHGTPFDDATYLIEQVTAHGVSIRPDAELTTMLGDLAVEGVCCGHSHVPRLVMLADGRWIVNPGSVGYPAYAGDEPVPHVMESGSPHARYAILKREAVGWSIEHIAVPYDWQHAAAVGQKNRSAEFARWIATGRAAIG
ncbi:MAG: metallophosphatase family protein [Anaerolineae bacterium]|nr:metallophosphatase family protein [Anaerolineae bacterium]